MKRVAHRRKISTATHSFLFLHTALSFPFFSTLCSCLEFYLSVAVEEAKKAGSTDEITQ
ncbi:hypothetical protein BCR43DRAFT_310759 [Syncephalastrum racemosum]|uniref:Uncharacterized protein n=1 Tax=Syncephalastrum racemosum TaxID=13706 RepID=A0A1X2HAQ0_SYNRA|nr:hypothetical protein BCR43DRAFT_310759 [Syncephalastrum racemosum]